MSLKLSTNSVQAWTALLSAIKVATTSIYIEMYIFSDDTSTTHDFVSALSDKASSGVQVILILDAFGSIGLSTDTIDRLETSGVEIRFFRHWIHRTHRKTIIIDGAIAFVGGVNITKHAEHWNDLQLQVSGAIARRLALTFARTYRLSGGIQHLRLPERPRHKHRVRMWILEHTPIASRHTLKRYYLRTITKATTRITFVTPYFVPHRWLINAMRDAISRGVSVEVLIPEITDSRVLDIINRYYATLMARIGVEIYVMPHTNHAKAILIDDQEGLIGSGNLDNLSFERNSELGIFFTDPNLIQNLAKVIHEWKESATIWDKTTAPRMPWYSFFITGILNLIHSFL